MTINKDLVEAALSAQRKSIIPVNSIDSLVCIAHPASLFKVIGSIPGSKGPLGRGLRVYQCEQCDPLEEKARSLAYDCLDCGIVPVRFMAIRDERKGFEFYYCVFCEELLSQKRTNLAATQDISVIQRLSSYPPRGF